mmetsp:Transcript_11760/g.26391  ORF Transcript_11760/g.26391 Transcript_11760/m.26391 type:complete len:238 (-) Transcript_11760:10-723(-)
MDDMLDKVKHTPLLNERISVGDGLLVVRLLGGRRRLRRSGYDNESRHHDDGVNRVHRAEHHPSARPRAVVGEHRARSLVEEDDVPRHCQAKKANTSHRKQTTFSGEQKRERGAADCERQRDGRNDRANRRIGRQLPSRDGKQHHRADGDKHGRRKCERKKGREKDPSLLRMRETRGQKGLSAKTERLAGENQELPHAHRHLMRCERERAKRRACLCPYENLERRQQFHEEEWNRELQ